jgi:hypothetical protein
LIEPARSSELCHKRSFVPCEVADTSQLLFATFSVGPDPLGSYKATISRWINPDLMKNQTVSVSRAKKAIADYGQHEHCTAQL